MKKTALLAALLPQILQVKELGIDKVRTDKESFNVFRAAYHAAFGVYPTNCSSCPVEKQFDQLMQVSDEESLEKLLDRKYKLGENSFSIGPDDYSDANMNDDLAKKLLKKFPGLSKQFSELPEGWEKEVAEYEPAKDGESSDGEDQSEKEIRVDMPDGRKRTRKIVVGDLAFHGTEPAKDGEYSLRNTTFTVVDGKVANIKE